MVGDNSDLISYYEGELANQQAVFIKKQRELVMRYEKEVEDLQGDLKLADGGK